MPKKARELKVTELGRLPDGTHAVGGFGAEGLALQVKGQNKSWVLRYVFGERRRMMGLGSLGLVSLADAREAARNVRKGLMSGIDPLFQKAQAKAASVAAAAGALTFEAATLDYITSATPSWKNPKSAAQWRSSLETYAFPLLGGMSVGDIQTAHVVDVLKPIWASKAETATRVRGRIETVISAADMQAGRERLNPARLDAVAQVLKPIPKNRRVVNHKALPYRELPAFFKHLQMMPGQGARALAWTIAVAARSGEVRGMTWSELDLTNLTWSVPAIRMKAGKTHVVPLTPEMLLLLPENTGTPTDFVFCNGGKPLSDMTVSAVLRRMGVDATVHGFRSSFRDWAGESTAHPREVIERALAHTVGSSVEQAYARGDLFDKRRLLMQDWLKFIFHN